MYIYSYGEYIVLQEVMGQGLGIFVVNISLNKKSTLRENIQLKWRQYVK